MASVAYPKVTLQNQIMAREFIRTYPEAALETYNGWKDLGLAPCDAIDWAWHTAHDCSLPTPAFEMIEIRI